MIDAGTKRDVAKGETGRVQINARAEAGVGLEATKQDGGLESLCS